MKQQVPSKEEKKKALMQKLKENQSKIEAGDVSFSEGEVVLLKEMVYDIPGQEESEENIQEAKAENITN